VNDADLAHTPGKTKKGASRAWGALFLVPLLGLAALATSLATPREPVSPAPSEAVFPLPERFEGSYRDDWGEARVQGEHEGTDVFAPEGTPIYSITDGTVVRARGSDENGWNSLGGYTVMVEAAYDAGPIRRGDLLYYAHLEDRSVLRFGALIEVGEQIGVVGSTGQGSEGTRGRFEPHLHLGWYKGGWPGDDRPSAASGAMNPYLLLRWLGEDKKALHPESRLVQTRG
jgi:murein DD-endopeptidase MepM/ murein hydrolase activator NlpD